MIKIYPKIEGFSAKCPGDGNELDVARAVIPGMRCLADATCPECGCRFYVDLPVGAAIKHPVVLNQQNARIYDQHRVTWFSDLLVKSLLDPVLFPTEPIVHRFFPAKRIIVINCLDFLYGHSLLKLLNVQRYLDNFPDYGCCVLIPSQLKHLVPEGVAEIWELPVPLKDCWKWYPSLQRWFDLQIVTRDECFLSKAYSHPNSDDYDLSCLVRDVPDITERVEGREPVVIFSYREDRLWGRKLAHQQQNLQKLYDRLSKIFPGLLFVLMGFGFSNKIQPKSAKIVDLRVKNFDVVMDQLWLSYMRTADCVVGVHGSNMLLPTGLSKSTVELVPRSRLGNMAQDFLFGKNCKNARDALLFYQMLHGNDTLSDVRVSTVTDMVASLVSFSRSNSIWFKADKNSNAAKDLELLQRTKVFQQAEAHLLFSSKNLAPKKLFTNFIYTILSRLED